jgi:hypothetical protein
MAAGDRKLDLSAFQFEVARLFFALPASRGFQASNGTLMADGSIRPKQDRRPIARKMSAAWAFVVERVTRIELALSAWEADVLPLNYTRDDPGAAGRRLRQAPGPSPSRHGTGTGRLPGCCSPTET